MAVANSSGSLLHKNKYDEYGVPNSTNGGLGATYGRFAYTGQIWIPELGMYHYKARLYAPGLGRFLQTDPVGYEDQVNLYAYVGNDPVNMTDPTGMCIDDGRPCPEIVVKGKRPAPRPLSASFALFLAGLDRLFNAQQNAEKLTQVLCRYLPATDLSLTASAGVGPVVKGEIGFSHDRRTGDVAWRARFGVGYGVAAMIGGSGGFATDQSKPSSSIYGSYTGSLATPIVSGTAEKRLKSDPSGSVSKGKLGPQVGIEFSALDYKDLDLGTTTSGITCE